MRGESFLADFYKSEVENKFLHKNNVNFLLYMLCC